MSKYAVVDLEMCVVPKGERRKQFGNSRELIQIGAVLLNESLDAVDTFATFVQPEYGVIDPFTAN